MSPSERFFVKLRKLTVCLETESKNLLHASQNLKEDDEDKENGAQALYQLHNEVRQLKRQVQDQTATHDAATTELRTFIRKCLVLKQRTTEDIDTLKKHYEKYGYRPRKATQENAVMDSAKDEETLLKTDAVRVDETIGQHAQQLETPEKMPPTSADHLQTPKLSDFGLSALHFQKVLSEAEPPHRPVPTPAVALSPPPFVMNMPPQPKTPKCSLIMEDNAATPRLEDFGISEYTMCWNNDFTTDLFNKKPAKKSSETAENAHKPHDFSSLSSVPNKGVVSESVKSLEPPVFGTPKSTTEKACVPPVNGQNSFDSPPHPNKGPSTPELPETKMPKIPTLQSLFGGSLACKNTSGESLSGIKDLKKGAVSLSKDEFNQDWCLATPKVRMKFPAEPCTPEMPDISSVTQDILKLVAQCKS